MFVITLCPSVFIFYFKTCKDGVQSFWKHKIEMELQVLLRETVSQDSFTFFQ